MAATDLYDAAEQLLAACLEGIALGPGGPISRSYVSPGQPPFDCEQCTVWVGGPSLSMTAPLQPPIQPMVRVGAGRQVNQVQMTCTVIRCVPVIGNVGPKFPGPSKIDLASQAIYGDCWAIWNHVATLKRNGTLFPPAKTRFMGFDPAVAVLTSGGFGGWNLQFSVELDGYNTLGGP